MHIYNSKSIFLSLKSRKISQKSPTLVLGKEMKRKVKFDVPASGSAANQEILKPPTQKRNQGNYFGIYKNFMFRIFLFHDFICDRHAIHYPFHTYILQSRYFSPSNQENCLRKSQLWY